MSKDVDSSISPYISFEIGIQSFSHREVAVLEEVE